MHAREGKEKPLEDVSQDPIENLMDSFLDRRRKGERPSITEYVYLG